MTRENMVVEGNDVVVQLQDQVIRHITAVKAHGTDDLPTRKLRYAADELAMDFDDDGVARKINGNRNANLVSTTDASETTVTGDHVDLDLRARRPRSRADAGGRQRQRGGHLETAAASRDVS